MKLGVHIPRAQDNLESRTAVEAVLARIRLGNKVMRSFKPHRRKGGDVEVWSEIPNSGADSCWRCLLLEEGNLFSPIAYDDPEVEAFVNASTTLSVTKLTLFAYSHTAVVLGDPEVEGYRPITDSAPRGQFVNMWFQSAFNCPDRVKDLHRELFAFYRGVHDLWREPDEDFERVAAKNRWKIKSRVTFRRVGDTELNYNVIDAPGDESEQSISWQLASNRNYG